MDDLALLSLDLTPRPGTAAHGSVRLHDAMRAYFATQLAEPALLHARLADVWKDPRRILGEYALQFVPYHLAEAMADSRQVVERGRQFLELLTNSRFRDYRDQHGDPLAFHRQINLALKRAANHVDPELPLIVSSMAVLERSYAESKHNPELFFSAAHDGKVREAELRLELLEVEQKWRTLARLLIAWIAAPKSPAEARDVTDAAATSCNEPELQTLLSWVRTGAGEIPRGLTPISPHPYLHKVSAILQRAGGAEAAEGLEPIDYSYIASGLNGDASAYIADQDGPELVAFANQDPISNTQYLERYIDIHGANRYRVYRNQSLWALLKWILPYPDATWIQGILQRIVTAALTVTRIDFEEFLPLAVMGLQARIGDQIAAAKLEASKELLLRETAVSAPQDSWAHYQRRACALAEVYALALGQSAEAIALLSIARELPNGFAGFRAFSALTVAETSELIAPGDRQQAIDRALDSAQAASHRIQEYSFCLPATAMVNAIRSRWFQPGVNLTQAVEDFTSDPLAESFCAVHRVLENFPYRNSDPLFHSLPIPQPVLTAKTLRQIAGAYRQPVEALVRVNPWIGIDQALSEKDTVNIPDPDFVPVLAERLSAQCSPLPLCRIQTARR